MICRECKEGRVGYHSHSSYVTQLYDHHRLTLIVVSKCQGCGKVYEQDHTHTVGLR
jgi:hypothetical protein